VAPATYGAIDIPPTRFWRFSRGNAIVLEVLLKDQEAEIIPERGAKTIVAAGKRLGLAGFVVNGREALESGRRLQAQVCA
jgi:hypothetical protein